MIGLLLAGGLARRMGGGDKPLLTLAGRTLLDHALERLRPQVRTVLLSANGGPERFARFGLPVVADTLPDHPGPLAGILAGMRWAQRNGLGDADLLSVPGDTPFLPSNLGTTLLERRAALPGARIAAAASHGRPHPAIALWPVDLADDLDAALRSGVRKVSAWAAPYGVALATFAVEPCGGDPFFNVNTPGDLREAERLMRANALDNRDRGHLP